MVVAGRGQPPLDVLDDPAEPVLVEAEPLTPRGELEGTLVLPETAASRYFDGGATGGTTVSAFHVPYWGSTDTFECRAKATISRLTLSTLAVAWRSSRADHLMPLPTVVRATGW